MKLPKGHDEGKSYARKESEMDMPQVQNVMSEHADVSMAKGGKKVSVPKGSTDGYKK